jgi:hypothetical protein
VTFRGLTSAKVTIDSTNYRTTDLQINQAIKLAINSDPVLSKLIKATDGPANTLVVTSLTDGVRVDTDLAISVTNTTSLTAAEVTAAGAAYSITTPTELNVLSAMATALTAFNTRGDYVAKFAAEVAGAVIDGTDSNNAADSTHTLGTGNDVLVLSTNHVNDVVSTTNATSSNETVVYNAIGFGADTIVNFNAGDLVPFGTVPPTTDVDAAVAGAGEDRLDFTALGGRTFTAGTGTTAFAATATNVINVRSVVTTTMDDATDVATLFAATTNTAAQTHIVVLVSASNVGSVYQVSDAAGAAAGSVTAALIGTIDLADTSWLALSADNFA